MQHYLLHRGGPLTPNWLNSEVGLSGKRNKKPILLHRVSALREKPSPQRKVAAGNSYRGKIHLGCFDLWPGPPIDFGIGKS
jgi:hypothetical protein